jgi:hypothetical protein
MSKGLGKWAELKCQDDHDSKRQKVVCACDKRMVTRRI